MLLQAVDVHGLAVPVAPPQLGNAPMIREGVTGFLDPMVLDEKIYDVLRDTVKRLQPLL